MILAPVSFWIVIIFVGIYIGGILPEKVFLSNHSPTLHNDWELASVENFRSSTLRSKRMAPRKPPEPVLNMLISEVNFDNIGENTKQFLELVVTPKKIGRPKANMFEGYFVLIIDSDPLKVVTSIHLGDRDFNLDPFKKYLVLGSQNVENINVNFNSQRVGTTLTKKEGKNIFPQGDSGPIGIAILYQPDKSSYTDLMLFKSPQGVVLPIDLNKDNRKRELIEKLVIDFVTVARRAPVSSCAWFDSLYPSNTESKNRVILRDFEASAETTEHSLNRCSDENLIGFQASLFKIGDPTPGLPNDCTGLHFYLEKSIDRFTFTAGSSRFITQIAGCSADYAELPASKYNFISDENCKAVLEKFAKSPLHTSTASTETVTVNTVFGQKEVHYPVHSVNHTFNPEWRQICSKHLPNQGIILGYTHINSWIDVAVKDDQCSFSCFYCKQFFRDGFRIDYKHKSILMTEKGYFSKTPSHNKRSIEDHATNEIHIRAFQYGTKMKFAPTNELRAEIFQSETLKDLELYKPTMQVLQFLYTEIKSDVSFKKHYLYQH